MFAAIVRLWGARLLLFVVAATIAVLLIQLRGALVFRPVQSPQPGAPSLQPSAPRMVATFSWAAYPRQLQTYVEVLQKGDLVLVTRMGARLPFLPMLKEAWGNSLLIFGLAVLIGTAVGLLAGSVYAFRNRWLRSGSLGLSVLGLSVPEFLIVILGQYVAVWSYGQWGWKPWTVLADPATPGGWRLPVLVLALAPMGYMARLTAAALDEIMQEDYIRTARSKGLPEFSVVAGHAFRNALPRIMAGLPSMLQMTLAGLAVVELVTNWPGIAKWLMSETSISFTTQGAVTQGVGPAHVSTAAILFVGWFVLLDGLARTAAILVTRGGEVAR